MLDQPALAFGNGNVLSVPRHAGFPEIHVNASEIRDLHFLPSIRRRTAKQGLHADLKFSRLEWLGEIVVGSRLETLHLVVEFAARGEHQNRSLHAMLSKVAAHIETATRWKHDVEDNKIEGLAHGEFLSCQTVCGAFHQISIRDQLVGK